MERTENQLVEQAHKLAGNTPNLILGIGDDAAVLDCKQKNVVASVDMLMDGVDFLVGMVEPELIGRKSLAVNLSDLAAMGATPHSVLAAVAIPRSGGFELAQKMLRGIAQLANRYHVSIAGGDTNTWNGPLVVSITAFGLAGTKGVLTRTGAKPGDRIIVTGQFGGSMPRRQFLFEPRIWESLFLAKHYEIHAAIDVSDGLLLDLTRMAAASRVGFSLNDEAVPIHPDAVAACQLINRAKRLADSGHATSTNTNVIFPFDPHESCDSDHTIARAKLLRPNFDTLDDDSKQLQPLTCALNDGEDFELILAVPPGEANNLLKSQPFASQGLTLTDVGEFRPMQEGCLRRTLSGKYLDCSDPGGFLHEFQ